jgi:tetratricopeptide (TPR) repeat protein
LLLVFLAAVWMSYDNLYHYRVELDEHGHPASEHDNEIVDIEQEAEKDTSNVELQLQMARFYQRSGNYQQAIKYYTRVEKYSDLDADLLSEFGMTLWAQRPGIKAVKYFTAALKIDSLHPGALLGLGIASSSVGENEQAIKYFDLVIKNHSETEVAKIASQWKINITK